MSKKYSLWLMPPGNIKKSVDALILDLSRKYNSPVFESHVTLLNGMESDDRKIIKDTNLLVSKLQPISLSLEGISFSTTYFQSVFYRVKSSPSLLNANLFAKQIFDMKNNPFMPHMSLIYGNHDMETREKILKEIKMPERKTFKVKKITIVPDTQNPSEWGAIDEVEIE